MSERLDRIERSIEAMLGMQAAAEIRQQDAFKQQQAQLDQLRRVLLAAIRIGRRDRSKMNHLINALTDSQLRLEAMIERHDARISKLENPN